jgi:hypothetical protein
MTSLGAVFGFAKGKPKGALVGKADNHAAFRNAQNWRVLRIGWP